ncbi:cytochrome c oxidase assembly protein [Parvularcula dongshanensis]|uniref:Putative membrane protein n=1 Tax=Parvularcula dongshanensis TaxID=1173995 RepID=A0A840I3S9_9PROT|nr:cytochrome c oxidase assembly protein [Parvularcula dongshanensis]MBB4659656.1 putative membrane protein [Parvularcula dongshanensis]
MGELAGAKERDARPGPALRVPAGRTVLFAVLAVAGLSLLACLPLATGHLSRHMIVHILLMSVAAPALALLGQTSRSRRFDLPLLPATLLQLGVFFAWHSPPGLALGMSGPLAMLAMQGSLLLVAFVFWRAVLRAADRHPFGAVASLLVTGKLICLSAVIWVFSPRVLFGAASEGALDDQHLAGLIMLTACPLTYIAASTVLCTRWLRRLDLGAGASVQ